MPTASELYNYDSLITGLVRRRVGVEDRDDCIQDIYLNAIEKLPTFRGDSDITTWLYSIASRRCADVHRRHTRKRRGDEIMIDQQRERQHGERQHGERQHASAARINEVLYADQILASLPEINADAIYYHLFLGLSFREMGELLDISLEGARSRYRKAIEYARKLYN